MRVNLKALTYRGIEKLGEIIVQRNFKCAFETGSVCKEWNKRIPFVDDSELLQHFRPDVWNVITMRSNLELSDDL